MFSCHSSVHLLAVVVGKVVHNYRNGQGHDLEVEEKWSDDKRTWISQNAKKV